MSIQTIIDENMEANKGKKKARENKTHNVYDIVAVDFDAKKVLVMTEISGETARMEERHWKGHKFYCQGCNQWLAFSNLWQFSYPKSVICELCVDLYSHEEYEKDMLN